MPSHYSRQDKSKSQNTIRPTKHIKTGLTAFQKSIAFIGSILSIIVASITIYKALHPESNQGSKDSSPQSTSTIVKIIEKDSSGKQSPETQTDITLSSSSIPTTPSSQSTPSTTSPSENSQTPSESPQSSTTSSTSTP